MADCARIRKSRLTRVAVAALCGVVVPLAEADITIAAAYQVGKP